MGLTIKLEDEKGQSLAVVNDNRNFLHRLLPAEEDTSYQLLNIIDWYGDTVFNYLQIPVFTKEWGRIYADARTEDETDLLNEVKKLATEVENKRHLYLRFYGD